MKRSPLKRSGPPEWVERGRVLLASGLSYAEIAREVGATRAQTYHWLTRRERGITQTCARCGSQFVSYRRQRFCSRECWHASPEGVATAKRGRANPALRDRRGERNPNFRGGARPNGRERPTAARWYSALGKTCEHPACPGLVLPLALHHVVYRQHVERAGGDPWEPLNGLTLCARCHTSHHRRGTLVLRVSALRASHLDFAFTLLGEAAYDYFNRYYDNDAPGLLEARLSAQEPC